MKPKAAAAAPATPAEGAAPAEAAVSTGDVKVADVKVEKDDVGET